MIRQLRRRCRPVGREGRRPGSLREATHTRDWVWTGESSVLAEADMTLLCRNLSSGPDQRVYTTRRSPLPARSSRS
jgi:hypothetical protein